MEEILICKYKNENWIVYNDKFRCSKCNFIISINELGVYRLNRSIKDESSKFSNNDCVEKKGVKL